MKAGLLPRRLTKPGLRVILSSGTSVPFIRFCQEAIILYCHIFHFWTYLYLNTEWHFVPDEDESAALLVNKTWVGGNPFLRNFYSVNWRSVNPFPAGKIP